MPVPYHDNSLELFGRLAILTSLTCLWIHEAVETLIRTAQLFAIEEYAVVGDSLGGFTQWSPPARLHNKSPRSAGLQRGPRGLCRDRRRVGLELDESAGDRELQY